MLAALLLACSATPANAVPPPNDEMANAAPLTGDRGSVDFDLTDATFTGGEPTPFGSDRRTIWFTYTPSLSGIANFSICKRDPSLEITQASVAAYAGPLPGAPGYDPATGGCPAGEVNAAFNGFAVSAGETYKIQVGSSDASEILGGTLVYDFNLATPPNDDFAYAQEITGALPQTINADNGLATREADEPGIDEWGPEHTLWYRWTPDTDGTVSIDTCTSTPSGSETAVDSRIDVFANVNDPADMLGLSYHSSGTNGCPQPNALLTHIYVTVAAGTPYWIRLANQSDHYGSGYKLRMRWVGAPEATDVPYISPTDATIVVGQTLYGGTHDWSADPAITETTVQWLRCNAAGENCSEISGETASTYVAQPADLGSRIVLRVTATNGVDTTTLESAPTFPVENAPVDPPEGGGEPEPSPPPPALDPFPQPSVAKSLGNLKLKSGKVKLTKLKLVCGATASGPCVGTLTITVGGKKTSVKLSVKPGASVPTTVKLSAAAQKKIKKGKKAPARIAIKLGAPGFSQKSVATTATISR